ncbi:MAG: zinc finger Ran-binding domain-containing protein [Candidatus Atabeyarchaeum deiterrae]
MEGQCTESSIDSFLAGKLRRSVMVDELLASYLPQFIVGKDKVRFKLKNCLIDSASFIEGDQNIHVFFYFRPPADPNYELKVEFNNGRIVTKAEGKWGNMGELVDLDEELKAWISDLYNGGIMRTNKKIEVVPKEGGSRVEISVKKLEKDWREALQQMKATPKKVIEDIFNIANRIVTGILNWQGKQTEPWNQADINKGRPELTPSVGTPSVSAPTLFSRPIQSSSIAAKTAPPSTKTSGVSSLPAVPSDAVEGGSSSVVEAKIICPMCGVENKAGSKQCYRCLNPLE